MTAPGATRLYNLVKAGSTVPLKFRVYTGTTQVTSTTGMSVSYSAVACDTGTTDADLIAATATGEVWSSDDGGERWTEIVTGLAPISKGDHYSAFVTA